MLLEGTLVLDKNKDTLLYAGVVNVNMTDWFFFKDKIELKYIGLQEAVIHLNRTDSVWNYQFLLEYFSSPGGSKKQRNIDLNLNRLEFDNISIVQSDKWRGEDMSAFIKAFDLDAREINFNKKLIHLSHVDLDRPFFAINDYPGRRPPRIRTDTDTEEDSVVNDPLHLRWNAEGWDVLIDMIHIEKGLFKTDRKTDRTPYDGFDGQHISFADITGSIEHFRLEKDSILADISFSTKERSGFTVNSLTAQMKWHPEAMEFSKLSLKTPGSHLTNFFAMRYSTFYDMGDFISKVRMEGNFNNAIISSDDIAYFAPQLSDWKKRIQIKGNVKGTVENLNGKDLIIQAGKDTYLKGNISMAGLPDINKTYIDFEAENFRTTFNDAVAFVPQLKDVGIDIRELDYLKFRGNFTGFLTDFVTYGTLETKLGTIVTDLNMKLPENQVSSYSGSIKTNGFSLGTLIDNKSVGKIIFQGKVNGSGLAASTLNAELDGNIQLFEFNSYPYQGITVKGKVAKKLFNGELIAADPNLQVQLNGLVDFSRDIPRFNFDADIGKADLKLLNLMKDQIDFHGKFSFNFTGSNIDNFLGTARVYDALGSKKRQKNILRFTLPGIEDHR